MSTGERLVEALEKNENGQGFSPVTFSISLVERVKALDEKHSVLILVSGCKIPVALPYKELKQKIYRPDFKTDDAGVLDLTAVTGGAVKFVVEAKNLKPGDIASDGSIYLGLYRDKDWFVADRDANLVMNFNQAAQYARDLKAHGHEDWIVPPGLNDPKEPNILTEMFNHKRVGAFRGTYNESGNSTSGWYWSSTLSQSNNNNAGEQRFDNGHYEPSIGLTATLSVRCVRAVLRP